MSTNPHAIEARAALDRLNQALTDAGLHFHLAGFAVVENRTYSTFTVQMTSAQAALISERLTAPVDTDSDEDKDWWEVDYSIVDAATDKVISKGTVQVVGSDEENALYYAGLSDPAHEITEGQKFVKLNLRKI